MPLLVSLRRLADQPLVLRGELPCRELDLEHFDELIRLPQGLRYDLTIQRFDRALLVQGELRLELTCECARCLRPFTRPLVMANWACHLPLEGEDRVPVCDDCVDLTPFLREDMVLAFPQHPLCEPECPGLSRGQSTGKSNLSGESPTRSEHSLWDELNKLNI